MPKKDLALESLEVPRLEMKRQQLIQDKVRAVVEGERMSKAVAKRQPGPWIK